MRRSVIRFLVCSAAWMIVASPARADAVVYESAIGNGNGLPATVVGSPFNQILGSRFTLTQTTEITGIGGAFSSDSFSAPIYGAILEMSGQLPQGDPFNGTEVLVSTTFNTTAMGDTLTPLSITLPAGDYALVFGSNQFGATGESSMDRSGTETPEGVGSFFFYEGSTQHGWANDGEGGERFIVVGRTVPDPSSLTLFGLGGLLITRRRKGG